MQDGVVPAPYAHETFLLAPVGRTPLGGVVKALGSTPRQQLTRSNAVVLNCTSLLVRTLVGLPLWLILLVTVTWFDLWETPADFVLRLVGMTAAIGLAANVGEAPCP